MTEKSSFRLVFGESPVVRVIDFFLDNEEFDYSLTDIARGAGVGWVTLHQLWPEFVRINIVHKTRRIGRAQLYKLNVGSLLVKKLKEIDILVSKQLARQEAQKQAITA